MKKFDLSNFIVEPKGKLAKRMIYKDQNVIAFVLNIAKGESLPPHTHFNCTVLVQVLTGTANVNADGQTVSLAEKELVQLDGPEKMSVDNTGAETLVLYVSISPLPPAEGYSVDVDL
ncbi:MAG: cupin [Bacillota bacterium]|nr:cupin [Bacillota bacterium]MDW7684848.1 cupin [Bacillota bacterium]